ncbi:MAG: cyclic nucleotide-binding domain-containing protein [Spirochaetales bacterium]|jgi:nanoRNase/pAp phosphatase (c-di-AMP/oligoRNAs hydrolase)|nr:cyclic nucleotide-binding domain-containing protein [Spirochaetales bacterium]
MANLREKISLLSQTELFASCAADMLEQIAEFCSMYSFPKGGSVFAPGDQGNSFYIVKSGEISVLHVTDDHHQEQEIARYSAGDFFGEADMLMNTRRNTEARAACDSELLRFPGQDKTLCEFLLAYPPTGAELLNLFMQTSAGRLRIGPPPETKIEIRSIAEKNRIVRNITEEILRHNSFLLLGHKEPDADCIASLISFALLLVKFQKEITIFLPDPIIEQLGYLLAICKYNAINVVQDAHAEVTKHIGAVVILDTPKPDMIMLNPSVLRILADPGVRKIEIDHHLQSDSCYSGEKGYRLVSDASSTCELIGYLSLKLSQNPEVWAGGEDFFSRNLILSILTGIVGDSQMGKYLKTNRERWYYHIFSEIFDTLLLEKTSKNGRNLKSMEDIFAVIQSFSNQENECYNLMWAHLEKTQSIHRIILGKKESEELFSRYEHEIIVNVSKAAADQLSEASKKLGLIAYYDDPSISDFIQFRIRRSAAFSALDLRSVITSLGITNGGGHAGAVGFRVKREEIADIHAYCRDLNARIESLIAAAEEEKQS